MQKLRKIHSQLISKKIINNFLDDFGIFGSIPFYALVMLITYFLGNLSLLYRLGYGFMLSMIVVISIKSFHYKDRPQKEEFTIFMEKVVASSFPSTHSLNATVLALLLCITYPFTWILVLCPLLAISVYIQRYVSKKHFVTDIIGGLLIGIIEVIFIVKVL